MKCLQPHSTLIDQRISHLPSDFSDSAPFCRLAITAEHIRGMFRKDFIAADTLGVL